MKTAQTLRLERLIWNATAGTFGCFEVTIGYWGTERVDYITYDSKGIWRCYEIKASKADFHSRAAVSFVGHYNYYVMSYDLYLQIRNEIPAHVGVHNGVRVLKKAKRQVIALDERILQDSMIRSLYREARAGVEAKLCSKGGADNE